MTTHTDSASLPGTPLRIASWLLAISYFIGAPLVAFLEYNDQVFSQRFDLPAELIFVTCAVQLVSSIGVLIPRFASWAAAALTVTTLGAIASHIRIGSPMTAIAAVVYTVIQVWHGLAWRSKAHREHSLESKN